MAAGWKVQDTNYELRQAEVQNFAAALTERMESLESQLTERRSAVAAVFDEIRDKEAELEQQLAEARSKQARLDDRLLELDHRESDLDNQQLELAATRKRLADRLRRQRSELLAEANVDSAQQRLADSQQEIDRYVERLEEAAADKQSLEKQLDEHRSRIENLQAELVSARDELTSNRGEEQKLREQLAKGRQLLNERARQLKETREQMEQLVAENNGQSADSADSADRSDSLIAELQRQRDELENQVTQLKAQLHTRRDGDEGKQEAMHDLQRRFEMAVESVRSLRSRNETLTDELNQLKRKQADTATANPSVPEDSTTSFDWEAEKRKLMAGDKSVDADPKSKSSVQQTVRVTDMALAQKDQEIAELRLQLSKTQEQVNAKTKTAAAVQEVDNGDWQEKLRAAEVEIAVERAQTARLRAELEEKLRDLDAQIALAKKRNATLTPKSEPSRKKWPWGRRDEE